MKTSIKELIIFVIITLFFIFVGWRIAYQINQLINEIKWGYTG